MSARARARPSRPSRPMARSGAGSASAPPPRRPGPISLRMFAPNRAKASATPGSNQPPAQRRTTATAASGPPSRSKMTAWWATSASRAGRQMPSVARPWGCPCRPALEAGTGRRGHRTQAEALGQSGADLAHRRQDGLVPLLPQPKGADKVAHPLDPGAPAHLQQQGDDLAGIPEVGPLGRGTDGQLVAAEVGLFMGSGGAPWWRSSAV